MAGTLAQVSTWPTTVPYLAGLVVLAVSGVAIILTPETVARHGPMRLRPKAILIPAEIRSSFWLACFVEMTA
ncbi:hypothetical protein ACI4BE_28875, partial [Klebsiella pneumoniae]|uniref:hypothetical protein n=1 Tax=Klebsiella pneumoniae TaxID=573 RepID=UPI00385467A9